jgi:hypothetical protein
LKRICESFPQLSCGRSLKLLNGWPKSLPSLLIVNYPVPNELGVVESAITIVYEPDLSNHTVIIHYVRHRKEVYRRL